MKNGLVSLKALGLAAAMALTVAGPAMAGKKDDTLHVVWRVSVPNLDPQHNNLREGVVIGQLIWDTLVYKNPDTGAFEPLLADSWNWIDNTTVEFKLKHGVRFHNGDDFSADDVVYTLNYVANPASKIAVPGNGSWIDKAEKVDDFTVRVKLKKPFPAAMGVFRGSAADLSGEVPCQGRAGRHGQGAGRHRSLQGGDGRRRKALSAGAQRGRRAGQPEGPRQDRQGRDPHRHRFRRRDGGVAGWPRLNREASVRICPVPEGQGVDIAKAFNLEYRAADNTASPYWALGMIVRAGLEGLRHKLPQPPLVGMDPASLSAAEREKLGLHRLPASLPEALAAFSADETVSGWLHPDVRQSYLSMKQKELDLVEGLIDAEICSRYASVY